jgi:Uma2 family endonuclease
MESVMAIGTSLMTAEEYANLPDPHGYPTELVKGVLVTMAPPRPRHGEICAQIVYLLRKYLEDHPTGRVVGNDSGVITEREPDTVRGADIAYYSFDRVPKGPLPAGLLETAPDLVFEVLSPSDRWSEVQVKVSEYLDAGVRAVCVVDDDTRSVHVFRPDQPLRVFKAADEFDLLDVLGDFRVNVERFFE